MYRCEICSTVAKPRTPAHKIIIETRTVHYPNRPQANACWKQQGERRKYVKIDDPGGRGRECVREVLACPDCAARLASHKR